MRHLCGTLLLMMVSTAGMTAQDYFLQQADQAREKAERVREQMREQQDRMREQQDRVREAADRVREIEERMRDVYWEGSNAIQEQKYEKALKAYDKVLEKKNTQTEGAMYWKAYTLYKMGRREDSLGMLTQLEKTYPSSRWLNDAKALQMEVRQASGQGVSPEAQMDEDLKLLAINSLMNTDQERAVPLLEKLLAEAKNSPRLKQRALFVLAQSRTPRAREVLTRFAKGDGNPDLQMKAVEYLGIHGGKEGLQVLSDVYSSTSDAGVKRSVLRAFMIGRDNERLFNAAKSEPNVDLRRQAIHGLGVTRAQGELAQLYATESSPDVKREILHALFISGDADKMIALAKSEKDPDLRRAAIHNLGIMRKEKTSETLVALYGTESDKKIKSEIVRALFIQRGAKQLVDIVRKESDPELKREIVHQLSLMKSKEATDYLMELLNK